MKGLTVLLVVMAAASISGEWGQYATKHEGNFVVKITKTEDNEYLCMGSIIYAHWVLTTANCLANENITITAGSNWFTKSTRLSETMLQSRLVTSKMYYFIHPNYASQDSSSENIGLVYIQEPFDLMTSSRVSKIWLPTNDYEPNSGKVFSWGERTYIYPIAAALHITNVTRVHGNNFCYKRGLQPQKPYLMCSSGHSSPRYLDEGGPLVDTGFSGGILVGIVNTQIPRKEDVNPWWNVNLPTHYTSVPYFVTWIFDVISAFVPPDN